jgi:hypothetical protein
MIRALLMKTGNSIRFLALLASLVFGTFRVNGSEFDWFATAFTGETETAADVVVDSVGDVTWAFTSSSPTGSKLVLRKYTYGGTGIWSQQVPIPAAGFARLALSPAGGLVFLAAGITTNTAASNTWVAVMGNVASSGALNYISGPEDVVSWTAPLAEPFRAAVTCDPTGNAIFAFPFNSVAWQGHTYSGNPDLGVLKLTRSGAYLWFSSVVGAGQNMPTGAVTDSSGNIYVSGFNDSNFASGLVAGNSNGGRDGLIIRFNSGGVATTTFRPSCAQDDTVSSLAIDANGLLWFTGTFKGTIGFGGTFGNAITSSADATYIASVGIAGDNPRIASLGSLQVSKIASSTPGATGRVVAIGASASSAILGNNVTNRGSDDVYVARLGITNSVGAVSVVSDWVKTIGYIYADAPGGVAVRGVEIYAAATVTGGVILNNNFLSGSGNSDALLFKILSAPPTPPDPKTVPVITTQPVGVAAYWGTSTSFYIGAVIPGDASFQWFHDGVPIAGKTSVFLYINNVTGSDEGDYYVEITNRNGTIRSSAAKLVVAGDGPITVSTIAGTPTAGFQDSTSSDLVKFYSPNSPAIRSDGVVIIADASNNAIRLLEPNGTVGTLAGHPQAGLVNGPASSAAFNLPIAVAVNASWDVFVADGFNHVVRKISGFGAHTVTTYAGTGEAGFRDGPAAQAQFNFPNDLVVDPEGNVYVSEFFGHRVRKITPDGNVSTFAGTGVAGFRNGPGIQAQFNGIGGIARDSAGNLFVTEWNNFVIRRISPSGDVSMVAGSPGVTGFRDGPALTFALLATPDAIAVDNAGNIFFSEHNNAAVRRITAAGEVLTLVGTAGPGYRDGGRAEAKMLAPGGIAIDHDGSLIVTDTENNCIRRVIWSPPAVATNAVVFIDLNPSITIYGIPGQSYTVQAAEALAPNNWVSLGDVTLQTAVDTWFDTQPIGRGRRFYRAILKN